MRITPYLPHRLRTFHRCGKYLLKILRKEDENMRKLKIMQAALWFTAVITTVLFVCVPFDLIPALYVLLVLAPQAVAIIFQIKIVKHNIIEHKKALDEWRENEFDKAKHDVRLPVIFADALHTIAELKSMGIHPNRAGPLGVFA